jgi:hypothetical protein
MAIDSIAAADGTTSRQHLRPYPLGRAVTGFFSPGGRQPPAGRFDSATCLFRRPLHGIHVRGRIRQNGFAQSSPTDDRCRRNHRMVARCPGDIRLVRMHGSGLQALGLDNAITTGPYEPCGIWADALFRHHDRPDGIAYASRHDPEQICVALFERADISLTVASDSIPLTQLLPDVAAVLRRYGEGPDL